MQEKKMFFTITDIRNALHFIKWCDEKLSDRDFCLQNLPNLPSYEGPNDTTYGGPWCYIWQRYKKMNRSPLAMFPSQTDPVYKHTLLSLFQKETGQQIKEYLLFIISHFQSGYIPSCPELSPYYTAGDKDLEKAIKEAFEKAKSDFHEYGPNRYSLYGFEDVTFKV